MTERLLTATLRRGLLLGAVWVVLTGAEPKGLALGVAVVPAAVWLSLRMMPARQGVRWRRLVAHAPSFVAGSFGGGIDVARRAVSPRLRLAPGWIEVRLPLSDAARVAVGAELSLMPGTLAAGSAGDRLLVHLLDSGAGFERSIPETAAAIAAMTDSARPEAEERS